MKEESSECNIMEIKQKIEVFGNEMWVNTWRIDDLQKKILKLKVERIDKLEDRIKFLEEKDMKTCSFFWHLVMALKLFWTIEK